MRNILKNRKRRVLAAAGTLGLCAALAFAAWLTDGSGPASGQTGSLQALTVNAGPTPADACFPGDTCAGSFTVNNPNDAMTIVSITPDTNVGTSTSPDPSCWTSISVNDVTGLSIALPPGSSSHEVADLFTLAESAPTNCQSQTFTAGVKVTASTNGSP
jgi:hypothetical protein